MTDANAAWAALSKAASAARGRRIAGLFDADGTGAAPATPDNSTLARHYETVLDFQRLAAWLVQRTGTINITHQALADELGTVREIVTRLLRRFEREGWVTLSREHIHISNSSALRTLASTLPA